MISYRCLFCTCFAIVECNYVGVGDYVRVAMNLDDRVLCRRSLSVVCELNFRGWFFASLKFLSSLRIFSLNVCCFRAFAYLGVFFAI